MRTSVDSFHTRNCLLWMSGVRSSSRHKPISCLDLGIEPDPGVNFARTLMRCRLRLDRLIHGCTMFLGDAEVSVSGAGAPGTDVMVELVITVLIPTLCPSHRNNSARITRWRTSSAISQYCKPQAPLEIWCRKEMIPNSGRTLARLRLNQNVLSTDFRDFHRFLPTHHEGRFTTTTRKTNDQ